MSEFGHPPIANVALMEELYARFLKDPQSVDASWRYFFEGVDFAAYSQKKAEPIVSDRADSYRRWGHLLAKCNPLEEPEMLVPELDGNSPLKEVYANRIGFEYMDLGNPEMEKWIQQKIEPLLAIEPTLEEKQLLLQHLNKSEIFELFLHSKYVGQTRFSLEGAETMIPLLAGIIDAGSELGVEEALIGMAHRGRLNVLTVILNKPYSTIFEEFEDDLALSVEGNDDVKYHMGFVGEWKGQKGRAVVVEMAANPSHLESVDPVVLGQVHAKQIVKGDTEKTRTLPILIHGDASLAGQGVIYESLQLMRLPNYSVGGTVHLVVNNQIGYTTLPKEGRSTRYATDIAKTFGCPVFHVNAEDPESCLFIAKLASAIRQTFHTDVFIDLLCYRKYGHNEGDEPSFTQPLQYEKIRSKKSIRQMYHEQLMSQGAAEQKLAETLELQFKETLKAELSRALEKKPAQTQTIPFSFEPFASAVDADTLKKVIDLFCREPKGFHHHQKLQKWLQHRRASLAGQIDWATGECLAFGSLLMQGVSVRLAGQDSQRGTFSQRHMVWIDVETGEPYCPLKQIPTTRFDVVNSPLTEFAGMGFEYGYSQEAPNALVLWEAQYGDFDNGAQVIIDQYIASGEQKWNTPTSLTLLLPHGYEGAGPEHSSARLERFLQLAANNNMQIVFPSTPSQYFHLLRRQALQKRKKPLIVFTPKSLLRAPACTNTLDAFTKGLFEEMLDDPAPPQKCKRLIFCSGKVFYALLEARKNQDTAIVRIEQLYPLDKDKLRQFAEKYRGFAEVVWVQEEPRNMGAWSFIEPYLRELSPRVFYAGRAQNATTATGSSKKSKQEQSLLLEQAFGKL